MLAYLNYVLIWSCHVGLEKEFFFGGVDGGYIKQSDLAKHAICTLLFKKKVWLARRKRIAQDINMSIQTLNVVKDALGSNLML